MPSAEIVREPLYKLYLLWRPKELHIGDGLFNLFSHFIEAWMVVGLAECPIDADQIVDALFLAAVLPVAVHGEGMAESDDEQSNKSRDENLQHWNRDVTHVPSAAATIKGLRFAPMNALKYARP